MQDLTLKGSFQAFGINDLLGFLLTLTPDQGKKLNHTPLETFI